MLAAILNQVYWYIFDLFAHVEALEGEGQADAP